MSAEAPPKQHEIACSFCSLPRSQVRCLIAGPAVSICDQCVALSAQIVVQRSGAAAPPDTAKCARHPSEPAALVCARCGGFACAGCMGQGLVCLACEGHAQPPPPPARPVPLWLALMVIGLATLALGFVAGLHVQR